MFFSCRLKQCVSMACQVILIRSQVVLFSFFFSTKTCHCAVMREEHASQSSSTTLHTSTMIELDLLDSIRMPSIPVIQSDASDQRYRSFPNESHPVAKASKRIFSGNFRRISFRCFFSDTYIVDVVAHCSSLPIGWEMPVCVCVGRADRERNDMNGGEIRVIVFCAK